MKSDIEIIRERLTRLKRQVEAAIELAQQGKFFDCRSPYEKDTRTFRIGDFVITDQTAFMPPLTSCPSCGIPPKI